MSQQQQDNQINKMQKKRGKYKRKWALKIEIKKIKNKKIYVYIWVLNVP